MVKILDTTLGSADVFSGSISEGGMYILLSGGIVDGSEELGESSLVDSLVTEGASEMVSSYDMSFGNEYVIFEFRSLVESL